MRSPTGVYYHTVFWQFLPVAIVFYTAVLVHLGLGHLGAVPAPAVQLEDGRAAAARAWPEHPRARGRPHRRRAARPDAVRTREALSAGALRLLGRLHPSKIWQMFGGAASSPGCMAASALHFWLRMKPFYKRLAPFLLAGAVLVPTLALLGFYQGGQMVIADADDPDWRIRESGPQQVGTAAEQSTLDSITDGFPDRISRAARAGRARHAACACCMSGAAA